jgi:hypothetical protein
LRVTEDERREAARAVHDALSGYLEDGEIVLSWTVVMDVAGGEHQRYLSHRSGGGHDGTDQPMAWIALGMLRASMKLAEMQLRDMTYALEDDEEEDE